MIFFSFLIFSDLLMQWPHFYGLHIPISFLPGYFYYAYFRNWLNPHARERHEFYLAPFLVVTIVMVPFLFSGAEAKRTAIQAFYVYHQISWREGLLLLGLAYNIVFPMLILWTMLHAYTQIKGAGRSLLILVLMCAGISIVSLVLIILAHLFTSVAFIKISAGGLLIAACLGYIFMQRSAHTTAYLQEIETVRYAKTRLAGLKIDELEQKLSDLMQNEKLFTDFELTLNTVAQRLSLKPHQLSEYLNLHAKQTFRDFINVYRVKEAERLLADPENENILQVAYQAGFGSKSSFNLIFRKLTGKTPSEYAQLMRTNTESPN